MTPSDPTSGERRNQEALARLSKPLTCADIDKLWEQHRELHKNDPSPFAPIIEVLIDHAFDALSKVIDLKAQLTKEKE